MSLGPSQVEAYWREGFIRLPRLFEHEQLTRWERRFEDIALERVQRSDTMILMKDIMVAKGAAQPASRLQGINKLLSFEDDPVLMEYAEAENLLSAVRRLIGHSLMTISSNVFNKPPGLDGRHPLHQDLRYFSLRPAEKIVAAWTAISACDRENGCLAVIPRSHRGPLQTHGNPGWDYVNFGFFAIEDIDTSKRVHIPMNPGDTLLFHPLLVHGSGRNRSRGYRRAISTHYASVDCTRPDRPQKRQPVMRRIPD